MRVINKLGRITMNEKDLTILEIEIILNALDFSKDQLTKVYQEEWLSQKITSIKLKLDKKQIELENGL
jgi:hypothetical protein